MLHPYFLVGSPLYPQPYCLFQVCMGCESSYCACLCVHSYVSAFTDHIPMLIHFPFLLSWWLLVLSWRLHGLASTTVAESFPNRTLSCFLLSLVCVLFSFPYVFKMSIPTIYKIREIDLKPEFLRGSSLFPILVVHLQQGECEVAVKWDIQISIVSRWFLVRSSGIPVNSHPLSDHFNRSWSCSWISCTWPSIGSEMLTAMPYRFYYSYRFHKDGEFPSDFKKEHIKTISLPGGAPVFDSLALTCITWLTFGSMEDNVRNYFTGSIKQQTSLGWSHLVVIFH